MSGSVTPKSRAQWFCCDRPDDWGIIALIWLFSRLATIAQGASDWLWLAKLAVAILLAFGITAMLRFALAPLVRG